MAGIERIPGGPSITSTATSRDGVQKIVPRLRQQESHDAEAEHEPEHQDTPDEPASVTGKLLLQRPNNTIDASGHIDVVV